MFFVKWEVIESEDRGGDVEVEVRVDDMKELGKVNE